MAISDDDAAKRALRRQRESEIRGGDLRDDELEDAESEQQARTEHQRNLGRAKEIIKYFDDDPKLQCLTDPECKFHNEGLERFYNNLTETVAEAEGAINAGNLADANSFLELALEYGRDLERNAQPHLDRLNEGRVPFRGLVGQLESNTDLTAQTDLLQELTKIKDEAEKAEQDRDLSIDDTVKKYRELIKQIEELKAKLAPPPTTVVDTQTQALEAAAQAVQAAPDVEAPSSPAPATESAPLTRDQQKRPDMLVEVKSLLDQIRQHPKYSDDLATRLNNIEAVADLAGMRKDDKLLQSQIDAAQEIFKGLGSVFTGTQGETVALPPKEPEKSPEQESYQAKVKALDDLVAEIREQTKDFPNAGQKIQDILDAAATERNEIEQAKDWASGPDRLQKFIDQFNALPDQLSVQAEQPISDEQIFNEVKRIVDDANRILRVYEGLEQPDFGPARALFKAGNKVEALTKTKEVFDRLTEQTRDKIALDEQANLLNQEINGAWATLEKILPRNQHYLFDPGQNENFKTARTRLEKAAKPEDYKLVISLLSQVKSVLNEALSKTQQKEQEKKEAYALHAKLHSLFGIVKEFKNLVGNEAEQRRYSSRINSDRLLRLYRIVRQHGGDRIKQLESQKKGKPEQAREFDRRINIIKLAEKSLIEDIGPMLMDQSELRGQEVTDNFNNPDRSYTIETRKTKEGQIRIGSYTGWHKGIRFDVESSNPDDWDKLKLTKERRISRMESIGTFYDKDKRVTMFKLSGSLEGLPFKDEDKLAREQLRK